MLSTSTQFARNKNRDDAPCHVVVKLTDGVSTWYFSDREMHFGTTHIYAGLDAPRDLKRETLDIFTKKWAVASMSIQLSNAPYRKSGATHIRPSEDLAGIQGNEVSVYLLCGYDVATFPDDCLLLFKGDILEPLEMSSSYFSFKVYDKSVNLDIKLPNTLVGSIYASAPSKFFNKKIPIVYGKFTFIGGDDTELDYTGDGLAMGIPIDDSTIGPKCVFADHVVHAITDLFLRHKSIDDPCIYLSSLDLGDLEPGSVVVDNDDSGRATGTPTRVVRAYLYMNGNECVWASSQYFNSTTDYNNVWDRDDTTFASMLDGFDANGGQGATAYLSMNPAYKSLIYTLLTADADLVYAIYINGKFHDLLPSGADTRKVTIGGYTTHWDFATGTAWQISPDMSASWNSSEYFEVSVGKAVSGTADGVPNNYTCCKVYCLRIILDFLPQTHENIFCEIEGKEYGTWIDAPRDSHYSSGACIEDPAGIIESLLRTYYGFGDSNIDTASFYAAENTFLKARINIHDGNSMTVSQAIRQLAEQSMFAYFFGANGKARLVPLNDSTPTTNRTILWQDIIDGEISITKSDHWYKQLNVESRYQQEYGNLYRDYDEYSNSTSGSNQAYAVKWPNINGTSAQLVARHLIKKADGTDSNDNGIWAHQHNIIEFSTPYFQNADLEIGDWIEIDDSTADVHMKCFNESWSGKQFLIIGLEQAIDMTTITAIELF